MKRFASALALCLSLLAVLSFWLYPTVKAKDDPILALLKLPAPPPPNPLVPTSYAGQRPESFYDKSKPPPDNAPIEDLIDYWSKMGSSVGELQYTPEPSAVVVGRLMSEMEKDPARFTSLLKAMPNDRRVVDLARNLYSKISKGDGEEYEGQKEQIKSWLTENTPDFSSEIERQASKAGDTDEYLTNHQEVLSFAKADWDRAAPLVNRLYSNKNGRSTTILGMWALYRQAIVSGSVSDADRYRSELMAVVEDQKASPGMRDLAFDALSNEKEWGGRDDWYLGLFEDETLFELRVNGSVYTGLTTLFYRTPHDQLTDRMIALTGSDNILVRSTAVKNLVIRLGQIPNGDETAESRKAILKSLLPLLSNKDWVKSDRDSRSTVIRALASVKMPEAVPALIEALDVKEKRPDYRAIAANAMNAAANAVRAASSNSNIKGSVESEEDNVLVLPPPVYSNTANTAANSAFSYYDGPMEDFYALRNAAVEALSFQGDMRAGPALRRVLPQIEEYYRPMVVKAMINCNAFTNDEKIQAVEYIATVAGNLDDGDIESYYSYGSTQDPRSAARGSIALNRTRARASAVVRDNVDEDDNEFENYGSASQLQTPDVYAVAANAANYAPNQVPKPLDANQIRLLTGTALVTDKDPGEALIHGVASRIEQYDSRNPIIAYNLRQIMLGWNGRAANALMLRDLKAGKADSDQILKLLSIRKDLREHQLADITDTRTGSQSAIGIAACLLEDRPDYDAIFATGSDPAKIALLACGRLIRAPLSVEKTAALLRSPNRALAVAAESFLESEDSPQARSIILSMYPNKVRILGAKLAFQADESDFAMGTFLRSIFASVNPHFAFEGEYVPALLTNAEEITTEKRIQNEVLSSPDLLGIYAYDKNFVRIYKDKTTFSWEDDPARFRERDMEPEEFEYLRNYLAAAHVDELPPFIDCFSSCDPKQLLMVGKQGGRRVFLSMDSKLPEFFVGLNEYFEQMRLKPGKLRYYAGATIPGLEVVFEDKDLSAISVWKQGSDLRVLTENLPQQEAVKKEIKQLSAETYEQLGDDDDESDFYSKMEKIRESRQFEGVSWISASGGKASGITSQPPNIEYIPLKDGIAPTAQFGSWSAKNATVEIRADETGLYKITGGHATKMKEGRYFEPLLTTNGKWVIVTKFVEREGNSPVRVNVATGREFPIGDEETYLNRAVGYIPERNLVILEPYRDHHDYHGEGYNENYKASAFDNGRGYVFLNPDTGQLTPASGEIRPIVQQTFRSLQPTATPGEYWAALPRGESGTIFGIYNAKTLSLRPLVKLPKIIFDSTEMWVEAAEGKVYFAYAGHVLRMNLPQQR